MNKHVALLLIVLAASSAAPSAPRVRKPRFFGLSSWFGGGSEEETTEVPEPDLTAHPLWRVHKYKGISLHPVTLPIEGGSYSPASHIQPPPSAKFPSTYGLPAQHYPPPTNAYYGPPATVYGTPAQTYGPPGQNQVTESGSASSSDISMGLDALGALASFLPDDSGSGAGAATGKGAEDKKTLLQSTVESMLNIKGNLGTAISGLASGKSAALTSLMNSGGGTTALLGLLARYPQLASFLARKHGAKQGHDLPQLPKIPDIPFITGMEVIPELPEVPEIKVPAATYGTPATTVQKHFSPPSTPFNQFGPPKDSGFFAPSFATAEPTVPDTTFGNPSVSFPSSVSEPRVPKTTYGIPQDTGAHQSEAETSAGSFSFSDVGSTSLTHPQPNPTFASRQEQPANHQPNLYTTVHYNDQDSQILNALSQYMARNSDTSKETYEEESGFKPSMEVRTSDPEYSASSFFPIAHDYASPFEQYREEEPIPEASGRKDVSVPASEPTDLAEEMMSLPAATAAASAPISPALEKLRLREYPVSAANAAFSDRFRGGKVHVAQGEVTVDTAMRVLG